MPQGQGEQVEVARHCVPPRDGRCRVRAPLLGFIGRGEGASTSAAMAVGAEKETLGWAALPSGCQCTELRDAWLRGASAFGAAVLQSGLVICSLLNDSSLIRSFTPVSGR